jgi:hypothetical protein
MERNGTRIKIDGEIYHVTDVHATDSKSVCVIDTEEGEEFYIAKDNEEAGFATADYWRDMAENDPEEFTCIVGKETLVSWCLNNPAGPGGEKVSSMEEWFELTSEYPEEHFASYDGIEREVTKCGHIEEEIGFTPTVAYRCN